VVLVRAWIRQALGASGVALVVPAAMVGVLALLTLSGGLGRIGNIGQAFSGPRLPAAAVPAPSSTSKRAGRHDRLLAALTGDRVRAPTSTPGRRPGQGASSGAPSTSSGGSGWHGGSGGTGNGSGGTGAPAGGAPEPGGAGGPPTEPADPSPSHHPSPGPTLVKRVTDAAASAAGRLPGPLGPAAGQTVEAVGSAAGALVPSRAQVPLQAPGQVAARLPALASGA
jgi:hypothetical protein